MGISQTLKKIFTEGLDYSKDSLENEVELHLKHITKMGRIIPRFADIIVGYSTDPGILLFVQ